jgi:hypothetical protein
MRPQRRCAEVRPIKNERIERKVIRFTMLAGASHEHRMRIGAKLFECAKGKNFYAAPR